MPKRKRKNAKNVLPSIKDKSSENCPYKFVSYVCDQKCQTSIFCLTFNKHHDGNIFAAAILNKILIFDAKGETGEITLLQSHLMPENEQVFALDWSKNSKTNEMVLVAGGQQGVLYDVFKGTSYGEEVFDEQKKAINDLKFSPSIENIFAAAAENGQIYFFNNTSQVAIASFLPEIPEVKPHQLISVSFDPTGDFFACGGEYRRITIWDLKRNGDFQERLAGSESSEPPEKNLLMQYPEKIYGCGIKELHQNIIDCVIWLGESVLLSKSADGVINIWKLKYDEKQFPLFSASNLRVAIMHTIRVPDCSYWFMRMTLNPAANVLAVGTIKGEVIGYNLEVNSFKEIKPFTISSSASNAVVRSIAFSHDSKILIFCTDCGKIFKYEIPDATENEEVADEVAVFNESTASTSSSVIIENSPKRHKASTSDHQEQPIDWMNFFSAE